MFDRTVLDWIQVNCKNKTMDKLMPKISLLGDMGIFWISIGCAMLTSKKYRQCGVTLLSGLLCGVLTGNLAVKNLVQRDRPCWIDQTADLLIKLPRDYSFPSGHTLSCVIASAVLMYHDKRLGIPASVLSAAVAFSRMYLYVHFPTDILGGAALGTGVAAAVISGANKFFSGLKNSVSPQLSTD